LEKKDRSGEALTEYENYLKILPHGPEAGEHRRRSTGCAELPPTRRRLSRKTILCKQRRTLKEKNLQPAGNASLPTVLAVSRSS